eukprot:scaffold39832_cov56-Phaeocystis_antarctica.AAC.2
MPLGVGIGPDYEARLREVVEKRRRLLAVDHNRFPTGLLPADRDQQLGARAARAGRRRCFRESPGAREAGIDCHAALRHALVLRVALPRRQRLWRRATNQRHDRSADQWPSAEHECRRAEQSEQRRATRHRPLNLQRAKAGRGW